MPAKSRLPEMNFSTFVVSLATSAHLSLGFLPGDENGEIKKAAADLKPNLEEAQHTIDILAILHEKTKGNLTDEEEELLRNLLYDLRVSFVQQKKRQAKDSA